MRLIDADELEKNLSNDLPYKGSVKRVLIQAPTVDAEPVIHGEWLVSAGGKVCTCPVCGDEFDNTCNYDIRKDWKRCPVCETKMG